MSPGIYFCRDVDKAKSAIVKTALSDHKRVRCLTISQLLGVALSDDYSLPEGQYYYIESLTKVVGEPSKITGIVQCEVEKMLLNAKVIVICVPKDPTLRFDFPKIEG